MGNESIEAKVHVLAQHANIVHRDSQHADRPPYEEFKKWLFSAACIAVEQTGIDTTRPGVVRHTINRVLDTYITESQEAMARGDKLTIVYPRELFR